MVPMGASNNQQAVLLATLLLAPFLAHAASDQYPVFSEIGLLSQAFEEQQQLLNDADVFQGFASRDLLQGGNTGTYPPTYPSPSPAPPATPCEICTACVTKIREGFTMKEDFANKTDAVNKWNTYCGGLGDYSDANCEEAANKISISEDVAKRPAALCRLVGDCGFGDANGCDFEDGTIGFCTTTGADTGAIVGRTNFTEGLDSTTPTSGDCLTSSNCNATSFCDFSMDYGSIPACDTETGLDTTRAKGMCLDKCELPAIQAEKERVALLFSSEDVCDNNDNANNCTTGFQCGAALTACRTDLECKVNTTTNEPELTSNSCAGMCFRVSLELDSAKFSDDADAIMVGLNELASTFNVPCQSIFNSTTSEMLGSGATCSVTEEDRKTLVISLTGDATVNVADVLTLRSDQGVLEGYTNPEEKFTGSATVATCGSSCTPPTARLFGPATIRKPCIIANGYKTNFIDSSNSFSASGRGLKKRTWGHSTACTTPPQELLDEITRANDESLEVLELNNSTLSAIGDTSDVTYCITLEVESFLGVTSNTVEHRFTIQTATSATPSVNVLLPTSTLISSGLTLSASVDTSSVCDGNEVAQYKWDCEDPCPLLSGSQFSRSIVRDISFSDLNLAGVGAGAKYTFQLTVSLVKTNSDGSTSEREADPVKQEVEFVGDPLVARFTQDSAAGNYLRGGDTASVTFDASASSDPSDPENNVQPMRFTFSCQRPDGISNCFDSIDGVYNGVIDGAMWTLDLNKFVSDNDGDADTFILRVEVAKGSQAGSDFRTARATRTISLIPAGSQVPVRARVDQLCGDVCPAASISSEPLSFSVAIENSVAIGAEGGSVDQAEYSWYINDELVADSHLLGDSASANSASITLKPLVPEYEEETILPRSGDLAVNCTVTIPKSDTEGSFSGSAVTPVNLEGAPICVRSDGKCINVVPDTNQTFPDITFRVQARAFSGANALNYEFGFVQDGETQVARVADSSPSADLDVQGGPGSYKVYVVAIDSRNGGRSARATIDIFLESAGTAQQVEDAAEQGAQELDFQVLVNTGSNAAVQAGMKKANAFKNAKRNAGNSNSGRRLLAEPATEARTTEGLKATLNTLTSNRVSDALGALSSIFETTPSNVTQAELLAKIVRDAMAILDSKEARGVGTNDVRLALGRLGVATDLLSEQCTGDCLENSNGDNYRDHWEIAMMVESTLASAWEVLRRTAAAGVTTQAVSPAIAQAVSRNTIKATSTAVVAFNVENGNDQKARARFANDESAKAFVDYCGKSTSPCYEQGILALYLSYVTNPAIYTNATKDVPDIVGSHSDPASVQPAAISGVMEVQFDFKQEDGDSVCTSDECPMVLEIPINTDSQSMLDGKKAACVRLTGNADNNGFIAEVVEADKDVDSSSTSVQCTVSKLGQYILLSYTPAPAPPPPPGSEEPSPSPSPPDQIIDPPTNTVPPPPPLLTPIPDNQIDEECTGNPNKAITMTVVFDLDRDDLNETNIQDLRDRLTMNIGGLLGLSDGLNCNVTLNFVPSASGRRLLDSTWNVAADLGESTPARVVRKSRRVVDKAIEENGGSFQEKLIGDFVAEGGNLTVREEQTSVTSDPDEFDGCSTGNPDRQISATITMDLGSLLDGKSNEQIAALEVEAASQMEDKLDGISNYEAVVGDCPVLFSFGNTTSTGRRSLLNSDDNKLTVTTDDDANGGAVRSFYNSIGDVDYGTLRLDGNDITVSGVVFDALSDALSSASTLVVTSSAMILTILSMVIASGQIL
mmetsp:Transcript_24973/g.67902  ORF Transcript_24973/g.67902 Transcript_24973/m.67902 type:complete len:1758 (-) Transcript_24973:1033-6306(-)